MLGIPTASVHGQLTPTLAWPRWLAWFLVQDALFFAAHGAQHGVDVFARVSNDGGCEAGRESSGRVPLAGYSLAHLLPAHQNHHRVRQTRFTRLSNLLLESPVFMALCASVAALVNGRAGAIASLAQNLFTNYALHW